MRVARRWRGLPTGLVAPAVVGPRRPQHLKEHARPTMRVTPSGSASAADASPKALPRQFQLRTRTTMFRDFQVPRAPPSSPARFIRIARMAQHAANSASSGDRPHRARSRSWSSAAVVAAPEPP